MTQFSRFSRYLLSIENESTLTLHSLCVIRELLIRGRGRHLILSFLAHPLENNTPESIIVYFFSQQKLIRLFPLKVKPSPDCDKL